MAQAAWPDRETRTAPRVLTTTTTIEEEQATHKRLTPWIVICWDDPVNTMDYVVGVFQRLFGFPQPLAIKHMLEVHLTGKSIVAHGPFEVCEFDAERLGSCGLTASIEEA